MALADGDGDALTTATFVVGEILGKAVGGPDGYTTFSGICLLPVTP